MIKIQGFNPRISLKLISIVLLSTFYYVLSVPSAFAIYDPTSVPNNKFGVHILDPNELDQVPQFVNNNGGDWGYVTVPIQPSDRDHDKWQRFMDACRDKHLIPLVRITTIPFGGTWDQGRDTDLVDFANFLSELHWPVANRYIILFNEVNRDTEWGGTVDAAAYARIVKNAYSIFKARSPDYYMLGPALDDALPNSATSLSSLNYLRAMQKEDSNIWSYFDGWAAHSYPNPAFAASPTKTGWMSITSYKSAFSALKLESKPVFITETGWDQTKVSERLLDSYWRQALVKWDLDSQVVAVTPFVLQGGEQFKQFSFFSPSGELQPTGSIIRDLTKKPGMPNLSGPMPTPTPKSTDDLSHTAGSEVTKLFTRNSFALGLENLFRSLIGLPQKMFIRVDGTALTVEVADSPIKWERGLSGRDGLAPGTGMLFIFPRPHIPIFWMKDMKIPLDLIWLKDGKIYGIISDVPLPSGGKLPTYSPDIEVDMVLEVPAGYSNSQNWVVGTQVILE